MPAKVKPKRLMNGLTSKNGVVIDIPVATGRDALIARRWVGWSQTQLAWYLSRDVKTVRTWEKSPKARIADNACAGMIRELRGRVRELSPGVLATSYD